MRLACGATPEMAGLVSTLPAEVEAVLQSHPAVEEAAVIGVPDVEWGENVAAIITTQPGQTVSADEIREFCVTHRVAAHRTKHHLLIPACMA